MSLRDIGNVLVIAEAGVNHDGDSGKALELVDAAAAAGADVVKFQIFDTAAMMTASTPKAGYQTVHTDADETYVDMGRRLELPPSSFRDIADRCRSRGIEFLATAFDERSIRLVEEIGARRAKIPSGEITNLPYLRRISSMGLPVIMSTGMATMDEVGSALDVLLENGVERTNVTLLHCTTEYPAPILSVNMRAMITMREAFGTAVGYSDHTVGIEVPLVAAALGASVIEKHLTLDRSLSGPDHAASLEPDEFAAMVEEVRIVEQVLGDGVKTPSAAELENRDVVRRSIVASRDIMAGEELTEENLAAKRPGTGISAMLWDEIVGHTASRDYSADEMIEL